MRPGIRGKLFLISLVLILLALVASGFYLEILLKKSLENQLITTLHNYSLAALQLVETAADINSIESADDLADRFASATDIRVTIIQNDGRVLGESDLTPDEIRKVENHGNRPEFIDAIKTGTGESTRFSTTVDEDMVYIARKFSRPDMTGVIRVAKPLTEVREAVHQLRVTILIAGLFAVVVAIIMSGLAAHFMSDDLRKLINYATKIAEGEKSEKIKLASRDEIGGLAGSINKLLDNFHDTVNELASERNQLSAVLDGMSEAVIALDKNHAITLINRAAIALLQLPDIPLGKSLIETIRVPALHDFLQSLKPGESGNIELIVGGENRKYFLVRASSLKQTSEIILVIQDLTELRKLESIRKEFVANVSHEMKTPVAVIQANAETLMNGAISDPEKSKKFLDAIHRNAVRLTRIISDLLEIARLESGRVEIEKIPVNVFDSVSHVIDSLRQIADEKKISLTCEIDKTISVLADRTAIEEILTNLIDNAVKYSHDGGTVKVTAGNVNGICRISVIDNGPGIPAKLRDRIFERFYRIDTGRSRDTGGTGLGLSIVKHLVTAMGGKVGMEPNEPSGSIFWFELMFTVN